MTGDVVGRARELASLLGWIDEALAGSPRFVLVGGDAGIGKTTLVGAAAATIAGRGVQVVWGRCTEADDAPPFRPWRQLLHALEAEHLLEPVATNDPLADRYSRFDAIAQLLGTTAQAGGGLVVILEDIHRADEPSLQLLSHVGEWITAAPLCVLVTHRDRAPDGVPAARSTLAALARLPGCRRLSLDGLAASEIAALLEVAATGHAVDRLVAATGGNPLLACELARHLEAGGDPRRPPATVIDIVRARLAARSAGCVAVLRVAAVVGGDFRAGLVATALGQPARTTLDGVDEAVRAGFVEAVDGAGRFRFLHALVRDGVAATIGATELAETHQQIAAAIEVYEGTGDDVAADLARHWRAASTLGQRDVAARWCERAAIAADRRLAWEDAARHYDQAVELGGADAGPLDRHRWLLGAAAARLNCDDISEAVDRCCRAADAVRHLHRNDLIAEAALVVEGRGGPPLARLRDLATEALSGTDLGLATRARLLGQLAVCAFYLDPSELEGLSAASLSAARASGDPLALIAAARARQMALSGPEWSAERLRLASAMGEAGRALGRPSIVQWETIWRIDALIELGRLPDAVAEVAELRRRVEVGGAPISRWHLLRVEALIAQATGRFDDALEWATRCCDQFGRLEDPLGGRAMLAGFRVSLAMHVGFDATLSAAWDEIDLGQAPAFLGDLPLLGPLTTAIGAGQLDRAQALYDRLAPVVAWSPPRFLWLHLFAARLWAAIRLSRLDDVEPILEQLSRYRGCHIAAGAGGLTYTGPVELWSGTAAAALGRFDDAVADLDEAGRCCTAIGARGFAVQADVELARVLLARSSPGDRPRVEGLLASSRKSAAELGMAPWAEMADQLLSALAPDRSRRDPLSPRELEVAGLVAQGLTNRAIAERLFLSERTAQNHVQHILTKLNVSNRTEIAAWFLAR